MPGDTLAVTTVNLNGIRAAMKRGFGDWLDSERPDVLLLQEVRAPDAIASELLADRYQVVSHSCEAKGRAGVAVALRPDVEIADIRMGIPGDETSPAHTGRWLEVDVDLGFPVTLVSVYLHSGEVGTPKQELKMDHLRRVDQRMAELKKLPSVLVAGDFNVVRSERDIKNWKPNHNKRAGVLDEEIAYLDRWAESGWSDVVRDLAGETQGPYSWWSWRGKAYDNDAGWRIDYQYATPALKERAESFSVFRAPSWDARFSDHAPVTVQYRLPPR